MSGSVLTLGGGGEPGPPGPQGPPGPPSTSVFFYRVDAKDQSLQDPGAGMIRWDAEVQQEATRLVVDWLTVDGFDAHVYYKITPAASQILIQDADLGEIYQVWELIAVHETQDWFYLDVKFVSQGGPGGVATFAHNTKVAVLVQTVTPALKSFGDRLKGVEEKLKSLLTKAKAKVSV